MKTLLKSSYYLASLIILGSFACPAIAQSMRVCVQEAIGIVVAIPEAQTCDDLPGPWSELDLSDDDWIGAGTGAMRTKNPRDRVGIGDVDPTARLHVVYDETDSEGFIVEPADRSGRALQITNGGNVVLGDQTGATNARLTINADADENALRVRADGNTALFVGRDGKTGIRNAQPSAALHVGANADEDPLRVEGFGSGDARLLMNSEGNIGIGTTNPETRLHIQGNNDGTDVLVRDQEFARMRMVAAAPADDVLLSVQARGSANLQRAEIGTLSDHDLVLYTDGDVRMYLRANGEICLGSGCP